MLAAAGFDALRACLRLWARSQRSRDTLWRFGWIVLGAAFAVFALMTLVRAAVLLAPIPSRSAIELLYLSLPRDAYPITASDVLVGLADATSLSDWRRWAPMAMLALGGAVLILAARQPPTRRPIPTRYFGSVALAITAADLLVF